MRSARIFVTGLVTLIAMFSVMWYLQTRPKIDLFALDLAPMEGLVIVTAIYAAMWAVAGRDPKAGVIVTQYEPPQNCSPAMVRYLWKEDFDDRVFWSALLGLSAKGLVHLEAADGSTTAMASEAARHGPPALPEEERILLDRILHVHGKKPVCVDMLDDETAYTATKMAAALREACVGLYFNENRGYVQAGLVFSVVALVFLAQPQNRDAWIAFAFGLAVMAPATFYLVFVLLRLRDVLRASRRQLQGAVLRRAAMLLAMLLPCFAGITLGSVVVGSNFGESVLLGTAYLVCLNLWFAHFIKSPTGKGRALLDHIEGFRHFLTAVDKLPMDKPDAPGDKAGLYEKYLCYALALEVEQAWGDRFVALAATTHVADELMRAHSFYLGMWDGKPVSVSIVPQRGRAGVY